MAAAAGRARLHSNQLLACNSDCTTLPTRDYTLYLLSLWPVHGRSSVARERYEIMYGRALQPPGGALPWQVEKVPMRDRSARAEHEKKYSTNMFDHTR